MAAESKKPIRTHVSGFVKGLKDNLGHKVATFMVLDQKFILPQTSTFTMAIRMAKLRHWNVLVMFDDDGTVHPKVTGVIVQPLWRQHNAAANGESYEAVKALCPNGRPL